MLADQRDRGEWPLPEAAPWRFSHVKRVPDKPGAPPKHVLLGPVFTGLREGRIADGFVRMEDGRITGVGHASELGTGADGAAVETVEGMILPGFFNNHVHLARD